MTTLLSRPPDLVRPVPAAAPDEPRPRRSRRWIGTLATPVVVFVFSSLLTFGLGALSPSNPAAAVLGETATPDDIARMNHEFGLDRPLPVQYLDWLCSALRGDLGRSYFTTIPVADSIFAALPVDLALAGLAVLLAVLIGGAAGIAAALRQGSRLDRAVTAVASGLGTLPPFVLGIGLIVVCSVLLKALPAGGYVPLEQGVGQWLRFAILPALALSLDIAASIARQLRTSLVGQLGENYVTGAVVRGLGARRVLFRHALRNAIGPALTVLGMGVPMVLGGAVVTEKIFNLPGLAQLALQASNQHDIPLIQGTLLVTVTVVLICNTLVNVAVLRLTPQGKR
ncbi:ABC transporter permease [Dactylosporangium aurantiacum]|uniref:ABC transporter permease n=1 Tax=Dactylosporangium aurantiacum TaxID=35754 RepID=A0A9Q9IMM4_9ACTN|nr:ABC transporter permease [Dactylosporangium aurantiacum]MDG6104235.1 ABC transporter permease [Dactylosporangium aurantiacum]UWZ56765.1 ABC transporter permease [Dactylosporangium aurantiacum]